MKYKVLMKKLNKNIFRYVLLGICIVAEISWLVYNLTGVYLFTVEYERDMFIFCLLTVIHAFILMCISIGGVVGVKKGKSSVLMSGLLMKLSATGFCLGVQYIFMQAYDYTAVFAFLGVAFGLCTYWTLSGKQLSKKYLLLAVCMTAEIFWLIFWLSGFVISPEVFDRNIIILIVHAVIMAVISFGGIIRLKKSRSTVLGTGLLMKIFITCFCVSVVYVDMKIYEAAVVFAVFGIIVLAVLFCVMNYKKTKPKSINNIHTLKHFTAYKAEWEWDSAAEEYCRVLGKTSEALTDNEKTKIFEYAGTPASYFLAWLIKRDFVSEYFKSNVGEEYINNIREEKENPVELFGNMDFVLSRDDISENVLKFVNLYFDYYGYGSIYDYMYDYYETIRDDNKTYYFTEFSWEKYHILEDKINRAYDGLNSNSGEVEFGK